MMKVINTVYVFLYVILVVLADAPPEKQSHINLTIKEPENPVKNSVFSKILNNNSTSVSYSSSLTTNSSTNSSPQKTIVQDIQNASASNLTDPPKEFPHGQSFNGTKIMQGTLENLTHPEGDESTNSTDSEVFDLNERNDERVNETVTTETAAPVSFPAHINKETELIENGDNTEDTLRKHGNESSKNDQLKSAPVNPAVQGHLAAILATVLVVVAVLTYLALFAWRRFLERRYGSRQILVEEDDFEDPSALKHFSI